MIKKTIILFAIIFVVFEAFLSLNKHNWHSVQYLYQGNIISADKYIFNDAAPKSVIIGTSLSAEIITDSLAGFYNLSMSGMSSLDGLNLIFKRKELPHNVFIEINYFYKTKNDAFISLYDSKIEQFFKKNILALRDEDQPVGLLMSYLKSSGNKNTGADPVVPKKIFVELLNNQIKEYSLPDTSLIKNSLLELKRYVAKLKLSGINVIFYEMPTNPLLETSLRANIVRHLIIENFSNSRFIKIPDGNYDTMDGVHLKKNDAIKYTNYFKREVNSI